jgi:hypothetical protein
MGLSPVDEDLSASLVPDDKERLCASAAVFQEEIFGDPGSRPLPRASATMGYLSALTWSVIPGVSAVERRFPPPSGSLPAACRSVRDPDDVPDPRAHRDVLGIRPSSGCPPGCGAQKLAGSGLPQCT